MHKLDAAYKHCVGQLVKGGSVYIQDMTQPKIIYKKEHYVLIIDNIFHYRNREERLQDF